MNYETQKFFSIIKENEDGSNYVVKDIGPVSRKPKISSFGDYVVFSVYSEDEYEYDRGMFLVNCKTGEVSKVNGDYGSLVQYAGGYLYYGDDIYIEYRCKLDGSDWSKIDWMCP